MKRLQFFLLLGLLTAFSPGNAQLKTLGIKNTSDTKAYFRYTGKPDHIISGHRGSHIAGYPENAIETFEYVLKFTPAFFEIDPRLTKDSVIVLLHDASLDRTTTGKGRLADFTWEEVKQLRLKDKDGKPTPFRIPTLQEAIDWARGKTVLNLDKKDVPPEMLAAIIRKNQASAFVMLTVHDASQALFYYKDDPNRMMSAFVKTEEALRAYDAAGVPWENMIAYIGPEHRPENKKMFDLLHARGVKCMLSAAPIYDKLPGKEERAAAYRDILTTGADILESDLPIEVWEAMKTKKARR